MNFLKVSENLERVLLRLKQPEHWCQNTYARDEAGVRVYAHDTKAYSFCIVGAVLDVRDIMETPACISEIKLLNKVTLLMHGLDDVTEFNDSTTHPKVVLLLRVAIQYARLKHEWTSLNEQ